ncbi:MAG: histidine phosphatase family protein [Parcubacteria group bacterium]|nr:histidine phosphatase family protein [Parcubacteria group bacterium]
MAWPKLIVFVRHAESEGNIRSVDERAEFDLSTHLYNLTPRGIQQAELTGKYLQERFGNFDLYYQSYYARTRQTLETMYPGVRVYEDARLAEAQRGIWHTMTKAQMAERFPEEIARKEREGLYHYRPWGGENWADVELRVHSFLGTLNRDYEGQRVLCAVHGQWLIVLQRLIHHLSIEESLDKYHNGVFANASVTIYEGQEVNGKSRLVLTEENTIPWKGIIA